jgi:hypothetical protein
MTIRSPKNPATATGTIRGRVITLDVPVPELEGRRVRVLLRPAEESEPVLDREAQASAWREWIEGGPQGAIDDGTDEFP